MSDQDGAVNKDFLVGAFVASGLALLAFFVVSIGGLTEWYSPRKQLRVEFNSVGGLKSGQPVRYAGHKVGTVSSIRLKGDKRGTLVVKLSVDETVPVYRNSRITIASSGLIGDKAVNILPPETPSEPVSSGAVLEGEEPVSLTRLLSSFRDVFGSDSQRSLGDILENADEASKNLAATSRSLRGLVEDNKESVNTIVTRLSSGSKKLGYVLEQVDTTAGSLRTLSEKLTTITDTNEPEFREIIENLNVASENLKTVSEDVKDEPSALFWGK